MKKLLLAIALLVSLLSPSASPAREVYETWETDPFYSDNINRADIGSKRWCNRWNAASWMTNNYGTQLFRLKGVNTYIAPTLPDPFAGTVTVSGCGGFTPMSGFENNLGGSDPNSANSAYFTHTNSPLDGDYRLFQMKFGLTGHLRAASNGHVPLYGATHPFCHAGVQSFINAAPTLGKYKLQSIISEDTRADSPECGADGNSHAVIGTESPEFSMDLVTYNGISAPKTNYMLSQRIRPNPADSTKLLVESFLYSLADDGTATPVTGANNAMAPIGGGAMPTMPTWYGKMASRFATGGQVPPQYGFVSIGGTYMEAHWQLAKVPVATENKLWIAKTTFDGGMLGPLGRGTTSTPSWHLTQDGFPSAAAFTGVTSKTDIGAADWSIQTANNAAGLPHQKVTYRNITPAFNFLPSSGFPAELQMELDTSGTEFSGDGNAGCGDYAQSIEAQQGDDQHSDFAAPFLPVSSYVPSMIATAAIPTLEKINSLTVSGDVTPLSLATLTRTCAANAGQWYFKVVLETPQTGTADRITYILKLYDSRTPNGFTSGAATWSGTGALVRSKNEWTVTDNVGFFPGSAYTGPMQAPFPNLTSGTISLGRKVSYRIDIYDRIKSLIAGASGPDTTIANWRPVSMAFVNDAIGSARVKAKAANLNLYYSFN